jgi:hypothetical protein
VHFLALILITLLLPVTMSVPSASACSTMACCGANCLRNTSSNQASCCEAPVAPDRATGQVQDAQHLNSIGNLYATTRISTISHVQNFKIIRGHSPPDRLASLALLCSRQI